MKKGKAIRQLKSLRKDAEEHLLHDVRDGDAAGSVWAQDVEALTAGIQALSAREADRTGRLRRDSKMLGQVLTVIADRVYGEDRPMFAAVAEYWARGWQARTELERAALNNYRWRCKQGANPNSLDAGRVIICQVALALLEEVYPASGGKEAKTND